MCSHSVYQNKTEALLNNLEADQKKTLDESRGGWKDEPLRLNALTRSNSEGEGRIQRLCSRSEKQRQHPNSYKISRAGRLTKENKALCRSGRGLTFQLGSVLVWLLWG